MSFQDEFLSPEPPARRRGSGRARGRPHIASRRIQRDLRDNKPAEQDDVNAKFIAETSQGAEPIPPAVPLIQPMFRQGVRDMLCPVAVSFMPEKEILGYDFSVWFYSH